MGFGRCLAASSAAPAANAQGGGASRRARRRPRPLYSEKISTGVCIAKSLIHILSYRTLTESI